MTRAKLNTILMTALMLALPWVGQAEPDAAAPEAPTSILDLEARRLSGGTESLRTYRGQVLLIVNTASRCGYTSQYEGLQALYEEYGDQGFSVLGFPSNDFAGQEPGSDAEIGAFCRANYGVEFPMFSKVRVKGPEAHPLYAYLTSRPAPIGGPVKWNFQKYLVDRNGQVVARYASGVAPTDSDLKGELQRLLAEPRPGAQSAVLSR
jgi:glutathione peroxidase